MRGLIFDLDGTLIDSREPILASLRHALTAVGHADPGDVALAALIGVPLVECYPRLGVPAADCERAHAAYREHWFSEGRAATRLFPGARKLLDRLRSRGFRLAAATAKTTDGAWNTVERFDLTDCFDGRVFGFEAADGAGKQGVVGRAAATLAGAEAPWMIGDNDSDAAGAAAHALPFCWCRYGYGIDSAVRAWPIDAVVDTLDAIEGVVA